MRKLRALTPSDFLLQENFSLRERKIKEKEKIITKKVLFASYPLNLYFKGDVSSNKKFLEDWKADLEERFKFLEKSIDEVKRAIRKKVDHIEKVLKINLFENLSQRPDIDQELSRIIEKFKQTGRVMEEEKVFIKNVKGVAKLSKIREEVKSKLQEIEKELEAYRPVYGEIKIVIGERKNFE